MTESAHSFRYRRDETEVARARTEVRRCLTEHRLPPEIVDDLVLVVAEVVTNAVEHGTGTSIAINLDVDPTIATIAVIQDGEVDLGDPSTWTMPPPESESGRGLALVRGLVDHAEWSVSDGQLTVRVDRRHSIG